MIIEAYAIRDFCTRFITKTNIFLIGVMVGSLINLGDKIDIGREQTIHVVNSLLKEGEYSLRFIHDKSRNSIALIPNPSKNFLNKR